VLHATCPSATSEHLAHCYHAGHGLAPSTTVTVVNLQLDWRSWLHNAARLLSKCSPHLAKALRRWPNAIHSYQQLATCSWPSLATAGSDDPQAGHGVPCPPQQSHSLTRSFPLTATGIMTRCSLRWQAIGLIQRLPLLHARGPRGTLLLLGFGG
jgi:hypothetical protein